MSNKDQRNIFEFNPKLLRDEFRDRHFAHASVGTESFSDSEEDEENASSVDLESLRMSQLHSSRVATSQITPSE